MSKAPKSAFEIAMEKLRRQDQERGEAAPAALSDAQRAEIAAIRARAQARMAEVEILLNSNRVKTGGEAEALLKLDEEFQIERRRIEDQREREIAAVRGEGASGRDSGRSAGRSGTSGRRGGRGSNRAT